MSRVKIEGLTKKYGKVFAADNINLVVEDKELFALLGPSGSGKTTIMRLIAGFSKPDTGTIWSGDKVINEIPPHKRNIGMVFQNYALFPHMSVFENIAFGLRIRRLSSTEIKKQVGKILELVQLAGFENRRTNQLSGGQQQRIALARALVTNPRVLLLDEPLGALDKKLRMEMQVELKRIQREIGITTIFVTHDQEEALTLSDRIAVINNGKIIQVGIPTDVYEYPANRFVADFLGYSNFIEGRIDEVREDEIIFVSSTGLILKCRGNINMPFGKHSLVAIRPEKVSISKAPKLYSNSFEAIVEHLVYMGTGITYHLSLQDGTRLLTFERNEGPSNVFPIGSKVYAEWRQESCMILAE